MGFPTGECVYVIHAVELPHYKIGRTKNINKRFYDLQFGIPIDLEIITVHFTPYSHQLEELLHKRFREARRGKSEWFLLSDKDIEFLQQDTEILFSHFPPIAQKQVDDSPYPVKRDEQEKETTSTLFRQEIKRHTKKRRNPIKKEEPKRLIKLPEYVVIPAENRPTISDEFQYGLLPEIWELYEELGTWEAVGKHYGVSKGIAWQVANNEVMPQQNELRRKFGLCTIYSIQDYIPEGIQ